MTRSYFAARREQERGVLDDRDLIPPCVFQRVRQVQCLVAVAVVLALAAGQEEDLGSIGSLFLGEGRADDGEREGQRQRGAVRSSRKSASERLQEARGSVRFGVRSAS